MSRIATYTLCSTHQPQWGSPDPRQAPQDSYCSQLSTGTRVTWKVKHTPGQFCTHTHPRTPPSNSLHRTGRMNAGIYRRCPAPRNTRLKRSEPTVTIRDKQLWRCCLQLHAAAYKASRGGGGTHLNTCKHTDGLRLHPRTNFSLCNILCAAHSPPGDQTTDENMQCTSRSWKVDHKSQSLKSPFKLKPKIPLYIISALIIFSCM